jgi:hypothetical protein
VTQVTPAFSQESFKYYASGHMVGAGIGGTSDRVRHVVVAIVLAAAGSGAQAGPARASEPPLAATWEVAGVRRTGAGVATVRLHDGRFLFCGGDVDQRPSDVCELWNPADGQWSAAPPLADVRRDPQLVVGSDGTVWAALGYISPELVREAQVSNRVEIWRPGTPTWRTLSELPRPNARPRLFAQPQGKMLAVYTADCRLEMFESSVEAPRWIPVAIEPGGALCYSAVGAWSNGTLVFAVHDQNRQLGWAFRTPGSRALRTHWLPSEPAGEVQLLDWPGDSSVLLTRPGGRYQARVVTAAGAGEPMWMDADGPPPSSARALATGDGRIVVAEDYRQWLWDPVRGDTVLLDDERPTLRYGLPALASPGTLLVTSQRPTPDLVLLWTPAVAGARPDNDARGCIGIEQFLQVGIEAKYTGGWPPGAVERYAAPRMNLVERAARGSCRQAMSRGQAATLAARLRGWLALPASDPRARVAAGLACGLGIREALPSIVRWLGLPDNGEHWLPVRAACLGELAEQADGQPFEAAALAQVRDGDDGWRVDAALADTMRRSPTARQRAQPPLELARKRRAKGHDGLLSAVCNSKPAPTDAAIVNQCRTGHRESSWTDNSERTRSFWTFAGTTVVAGGLVAGAHLGRERPFSQGIATASGAAGGLTIGAGVGALVGALGASDKAGGSAITGATIGGILGGVAGGTAAYLAARQPGARGATTAVGVAVPVLLLLAIGSAAW